MSRAEKLSKRLVREHADLKQRRKRQLALFRSTKRRGHARKAAQLGRKMRHKVERGEELQAALDQGKSTWKLEFAARFIAPWEGLLTTAYQDSGGIWTIGYGHTGPDVYPGLVWSTAKALRYLTSDLRAAARCVAQSVEVPLTTRERIACISAAFNWGCGGLNESTFLRKLNEGDRKGAADALLMWVKDANGNTLLGLKRRREAERWLFYHPKKKEK